MARNASGTHSLPSGNPVVSGTSISSTVQNATTADISTEITDSLSRSGKGAMLAPLKLTNGTVGVPAAAFDSDTDTGLYRKAANTPAMAAGGAEAQEWSATGTTVPGTLTVTGATTHSAATIQTGALTCAAGVTATQSTTNGNGLAATGNGDGHGVLGTAGSSGVGAGVKGVNTHSGLGVSAESNDIALQAVSTSAVQPAIYAVNTDGGLAIKADTGSSPLRAALAIRPSAQPTSSQIGDLYITTAGVLKICTAAGTPGTWVSVGTQT